MGAYMGRDLLTVLPTLLVPTLVILGSITYMVLFNKQTPFGASRLNFRHLCAVSLAVALSTSHI